MTSTGACATRQPLRRLALSVMFSALVLSACQGAPRHEAERIEPVYRADTGALTLLKHDADKNGVVDIFSYMEGPRILRIEIDQDQDGTIDRWEHYGPSQSLERVGFSRARDGREDAWSYADASGRLVRIEVDTRRDGTISRTEHYTSGSLARAEEDSDGDGRTDRWEEYSSGRLVRVSFDTAHRGAPTHSLAYGGDGTARVEIPSSSPQPTRR